MADGSGSIVLPTGTTAADQTEQMQAMIASLQDDAATVQTSLQVAWMFLNACLIFLMQVRFEPAHLRSLCDG